MDNIMEEFLALGILKVAFSWFPSWSYMLTLFLYVFCNLLPFSFTSPANFADSVVDKLPADISTGIYYGWACVGNGDVHKMVMSIGWNPYYKNTKKSMVSTRRFYGSYSLDTNKYFFI